MKIVHLITSLKFGGAENFLLQLCSNLNKKDITEQVVIYFYDGPIKKEIENLGIKTYKVQGLLFYWDFFAFYKLIKLLKQIKPDIIFSLLWSANFLGSFAAKFLNIPIVCSLHTIYNKEGKLRNWLDSIALPKASKIVAVSNNVALSAKNKIKRLDKLTVISNGIDSNFIEKNINQSIKKDLNIPENHFIIGAVGRFVKLKNHDLLVKAFYNLSQNFSDIYLVLIGSGPEYKNLKNLVKKLNLNSKVKFIVNEHAYKYLTLLDCFVQPSDYESISIALLEAMCAKLACISTGANKTHQVLKDNYNGLVINPNITEISEAIEKIYKNKCLRNKFKINAYKTAKKEFTIEKAVDSYYNLFSSITNLKNINNKEI